MGNEGGWIYRSKTAAEGGKGPRGPGASAGSQRDRRPKGES